MQQYSTGLLAGFELTGTRYAVTVALERFETLAPIIDGPVTFRHIHIAISPPSPSQYSRKRSKMPNSAVATPATDPPNES